MAEEDHRAGVVALLGLPNAGKSTLLNRLMGEKLAIVTPKPQTTRSRILGILTRAGFQALLFDTPGFHEGGRPLDAAMREAIERALEDCDLGVVLIDPLEGFQPCHAAWIDTLDARGVPALVVGTKIDDPKRRRQPWPPEPAVGRARACLRISAWTGEGLDELERAIRDALPASPPYYPADELTDRPLRFLAAEEIREAAFLELRQELPYALAVEVLEFDESRPGRVRIRAQLLVERESQKRIAVGAGGSMIKRIGQRARLALEERLGARVFLDLRVKVDPHWARRPGRLKALGYH